MIYKVNGYGSLSRYFDDATNPNAKADAETFLTEMRSKVLTIEASRFSICATFVNGNATTWREIQESDPEDTVCQVFDTYTGKYTQCDNKTQAYALNETKKEAFLKMAQLDKVYELEAMPIEDNESQE